MDWTLVLVLQVMFQPCLSAVLFTVEAERTSYMSEFGGDVVMGCRFQPVPSNPDSVSKVTWHWILSNSVREVYRMERGQEKLSNQDPDFKGRVTLLTDELRNGWAKLQVSRLRINDSGTYQCLVQTGEGADYKEISLSVTAPYKSVRKRIKKAPEGGQVLLSCEAEGYPGTSVVWQGAHLQNLSPNTTSVSTPDELFKVISQIRVSSSDRNNYTCSFSNDGYNATFHIPEEIPPPPGNNEALIPVAVLSIAGILGAAAAVFVHQRRKDLQTKAEKEEEIPIFHEDYSEEDLGKFLKGFYRENILTTKPGRHWNAASAEVSHRLQNNDGQSVTLQALLPDVGGTLLLEGPSGSGKTILAHMLVSSWTEGPTDALADLLDLSALRLLLHVDCSTEKRDLFQEMTSPLPPRGKVLTEDQLRTVLTRSNSSLLLLDGYREGNFYFDESLRRFLGERKGCRVLVMSRPEHCPTFKKTVGTEGLLKLQTQTAKY